MKRILSILAAVVVSMQAFAAGAFADADVYIPDSTTTQFLPTVKIIVYTLSYDGNLVPEGLGSGTLIDDEGTILTNNHVIQDYYDPSSTYDAFQVCLTRANSPSDPICNYTASFIERDPDRDIALLRMDDKDVQGDDVDFNFYLSPSADTPEVGSEVTVIGFPDTGGKTVTITSGLVSGFLEDGGVNYIKTDADISFGNSGGTAVTEDGDFVGIPTFIIGSFSAEVLGYLVPVAEIMDWIDENKGKSVQRNEVAADELKTQIKAYLDANESGTYENDYPVYEISLVDGWKFASLLEGSLDSDILGFGYSSGGNSISLFPESVSDYAPTSVTVYSTDYSYDVGVQDVIDLLDEYYEDGFYEADYYETELNGVEAVFETSSYVDWWYLNGETVYTDTYYIPYGNEVVSLTASYVDSDFENGYYDEIEEIIATFGIDLDEIESTVVSEVSSDDPQITVSNPVSDFFLSDTSYDYGGVNYFGVNFGKKGDYDFYLSLYYNTFWDESYVGQWDLFEEETLESVEEWSEIVNSGKVMIDGHRGFFYTDEYDSGYSDELIYSTTVYIRYDDESYFSVYYSQGSEGYAENVDDVVTVLKAVELSNDGNGIYNVPNFLKGATRRFVDIDNYVYEENIRSLNREGAFMDAPEFFEPEKAMTREEFVVWAVNTLQGDAALDFDTYEEEYNGCQNDCLSDFDYSSESAVYVEYARSMGAVGANGTLDPEGQVSMMAALKVLVELNGYEVWQAPEYVPWYLPYLHYGYSNYAMPYGVDEIGHLLSRGEAAYMIDVLNIQPNAYYWY